MLTEFKIAGALTPSMDHKSIKITTTRYVPKLPENFGDLIDLFYRNLNEITTVPLCSEFRTFALIEAESGRIYTGTNIEGWNFLNCWCAERAAISDLSRYGEAGIRNIVIGSKNPDLVLTPGGPCREMILDFSGKHTLIIMPSEKEIFVSTAMEMYPYPSPYRVKAMPFTGSKVNVALIKAAEALGQRASYSLEKMSEDFPEFRSAIEVSQELVVAAITPYYGLKSATVIQCEHGDAHGVSIESLEYCSSISSCKSALANALASRSRSGRMLRMVTVDQFNTILPPVGETRQLMVDTDDIIHDQVKDLKILLFDYMGNLGAREVSVFDLMPYPSRIS